MFYEHCSLSDCLYDFITEIDYSSLLNDNTEVLESTLDSTLTVSLTPFGHVSREC